MALRAIRVFFAAVVPWPRLHLRNPTSESAESAGSRRRGGGEAERRRPPRRVRDVRVNVSRFDRVARLSRSALADPGLHELDILRRERRIGEGHSANLGI